MDDNTKFEYVTVNYTISSTRSLVGNDKYEHYNYHQKIIGTISVSGIDNDLEVKVGDISATKVLTDQACNFGISKYDLFDYTQDSFEVFEFLFDDGEYHKSIDPNFNIFSENVLILDHIEMLPEYKGNGFGKKAIENLLSNFGDGCGVMAIHSFPLEFGGSHEEQNQDDYDAYQKRFKGAQSKLNKFYKGIGMKNPRKNFKNFFYIDCVNGRMK